MSTARHTPGPWEYVPSNENHGPYVANAWGAGDICDCYVMSNPREPAVCNGGTSRPIHHQYDEADANARLIAAAPDMREALIEAREQVAILQGRLGIKDAPGGTLSTLDAVISRVEDRPTRSADDEAEDAYQRQQDALMESGGPDDSTYRRDVINAGRGHLLPR